MVFVYILCCRMCPWCRSSPSARTQVPVVRFGVLPVRNVSIFSSCLETHPSMRVPVVRLGEFTLLPVRNVSELINDLGGLEPDLNGTSKPPLLRRMLTKQRTEPHRAFFHFECLCNVWFVFELTVRFLVSPRKRRIFRAPVNIIDVVRSSPPCPSTWTSSLPAFGGRTTFSSSSASSAS